MTASRVDVIVPTHNYARYLPDAIRSLQAQTLADWACVVVDDGSTDDTPAVAAALCAADLRVRYTRLERHGVSHARNVGLRAGTAAYVQFLDADDTLEPDKLRTHVDYLDQHRDVDIVFGDAASFGDALQVLPVSPDDLAAPVGSGDEVMSRLVIRNPFVISAPLARRAVLEQAGGFAEELTLVEDWDLWVRCATGGARFARESPAGARALIRMHDRSASRDRRRMRDGAIRARRRFATLPLSPSARRANARFLVRAAIRATCDDIAGLRLGSAASSGLRALLDLPAALR